MDNHLFKIDKDIPIPLYYQLKQSILTYIQRGLLKGGDILPTEMEFCERCKISRPTVRQAINELVAEGYLYRLKGKGTFVAIPKIDARFLNKLQSFEDEMVAKGLIPSTEVLTVKEVKAKPLINTQLEIGDTSPLIYLERVRYADGEPIVYLETYLPCEPYRELLTKDFKHYSLYHLLEENFNLSVQRVFREIEAISATTKVANLLEIKKQNPICLVTTVAYTEENQPIEYSIARYRGDRNKFSVELYR